MTRRYATAQSFINLKHFRHPWTITARVWLLLLSSLCLWPSFDSLPLRALDPSRPLQTLGHRSWDEKDGEPGKPLALAQDNEGFLLIGVEDGLYRFDGMRFERYQLATDEQLPHSAVLALLALPDGKLWVGWRDGGIAIIQNGRMVRYNSAQGVPDGAINEVVRDQDGTVWAATDSGLIRFDGQRWERIGKTWGLPDGLSQTVFVGRTGTIWLSIKTHVFYLPRGSKRFEQSGDFAFNPRQLAEAHDGTIWVADAGAAVRPIGMRGSSRMRRAECREREYGHGLIADDKACPATELEVQVGSKRILFDQDGSLWITTVGDGLRRAPYPERLANSPIPQFSKRVETYTSKDGLTADYAVSALEDREGNVWVGTRTGLDEFYSTKLVPVVFPGESGPLAVAPGNGGDIWVTNNTVSVARLHGYSADVAFLPCDCAWIYRDGRGIIWDLGWGELQLLENGKIRTLAPMPATRSEMWQKSDAQITADINGKLWAFVGGMGFFSLEGTRWKSLQTPHEALQLEPSSALTDAKGRIWVATKQGAIITMENGNVGIFSPDEVGIGETHAIFQLTGHIWVGGDGGLAMFDGKHFQSIHAMNDQSFTNVVGVTGTEESGLWLSETRGVVHIPVADVGRWVADPRYGVHTEILTSFDGLPGSTIDQYGFNRSVSTVGTDGRLWFAASKGLAWVDPQRIRRDPEPPPVAITSLVADGTSYFQPADVTLPPHTANIAISYTALSLTVPAANRFRYKLDGIDTTWQEAGTRRDVYYSRLPPGSYVFHVIARNNDGVWNMKGEHLLFTILPTFYQTTWFCILTACLALLILWALFQLRLRAVTVRIEMRLGERLLERDRIARELHDTLLQGFQALLLQLQTAIRRIPDGEPERENALLALNRGDEILLEGRNRVRDLRSHDTTSGPLVEMLEKVLSQLQSLGGPQLHLAVDGQRQSVRLLVAEELSLFAREALSNAVHHSQATQIRCELHFDPRGLRLIVQDNGIGIPQEKLKPNGNSGHWGLQGMRERSQKIDAKMKVESGDFGTLFDLRVPRRVAYEHAQRSFLEKLRSLRFS